MAQSQQTKCLRALLDHIVRIQNRQAGSRLDELEVSLWAAPLDFHEGRSDKNNEKNKVKRKDLESRRQAVDKNRYHTKNTLRRHRAARK